MAFKVCLKMFSFKGVVWTKDSLVLGWSGQKTPWCQGWISTKESFGQITPTPRSLLARSPLKTLKAIFRKSKKHQGVFCPDHCRVAYFLFSFGHQCTRSPSAWNDFSAKHSTYSEVEGTKMYHFYWFSIVDLIFYTIWNYLITWISLFL